MKKDVAIVCIVIFFTTVLQSCAKNTDSSSGSTTGTTTGTGTGTGTTTTGTVSVSTLAGSDVAGFSDGTGAGAKFNHPWGVVTDYLSNVYVADHNNNLIRKINTSGVVTTIAGNDTAGFADGTGTLAQFNLLNLLAADAQGNIYAADQNNNRIRKITSQGAVTTFAGNGTQGIVNTAATSAEFSLPAGIAMDAQGNTYVADQFNNVIRKISSAGVVTTFAGSVQGFSNGTATAAAFNAPVGITADAQGDLFVTEKGNQDIREIATDGTVTTLAGNGVPGYQDGTGLGAEFNNPAGITIDAQGNLYVADASNNRIRKITTAGVVTTIAGTGGLGFADGVGASAQFNTPWGITIDSQGNLYIGDSGNNRIRKISIQ